MIENMPSDSEQPERGKLLRNSLVRSAENLVRAGEAWQQISQLDEEDVITRAIIEEMFSHREVLRSFTFGHALFTHMAVMNELGLALGDQARAFDVPISATTALRPKWRNYIGNKDVLAVERWESGNLVAGTHCVVRNHEREYELWAIDPVIYL